MKKYTIEELKEMASAISKTKIMGTNSYTDIFALMIIANENEESFTDYDIILGRISLKSQAVLIRFQKAGGKIKYLKRDDNECTIEFYHNDAGSLIITWDMARARQAGLNINKQNWKQYPRQMLSARCIAEGVRALYPACLKGMYLSEEVQDFEANSPQLRDKNINENNINENNIDNSQYDINTNTYINYDICPLGNNKGRFWKDLDIGTLDKALQYYKEKNENNYSNVIEKILLEKIEREKTKDRETISVSEDEEVYNEEDGFIFDNEDEAENNDIIDFGEGEDTK